VLKRLRDAGWKVSENTVAAVMREQHLAARRKKRHQGATRPGRGRWRAPDLEKRDFNTGKINRKWFGDGTEIVTRQGKPPAVRSGLDEHLECLAVVHGAVAVRDLVEADGAVEDLAGLHGAVEHAATPGQAETTWRSLRTRMANLSRLLGVAALALWRFRRNGNAATARSIRSCGS